METAWSRKEFSKKGGVSDRKISFYTEQGMFPDLRRDVGRGAARIYTTAELRDLLLIVGLKKCGLPLNKIKGLITYVHAIQDKWLPNGCLVDEAFYIQWNPSSREAPFSYFIGGRTSGNCAEKVEIGSVLLINLRVLFQGSVVEALNSGDEVYQL